MTRKLTNAEVFDSLDKVSVVRTPGSPSGDTTLGTNTAAGSTSLSVASETGFSAGDLIRIGADATLEVHEVGSVTTGSITLVTPTAFAHDSGEVVKSTEKVEIGDLTDDGVSQDANPTRNELLSATQLTPYAYLLQHYARTVTFEVHNYTEENLALALGIPEGNITGSGTSADPTVLHETASDVMTENQRSLIWEGTRKDGQIIEVRGFHARIDPSRSLQYVTGQGMPVPFAANVHHIMRLSWS